MVSARPQSQINSLPFKSAIPGVVFPALPGPKALPIMAVLYQLERNQWLDAAAHRSRSFGQLHSLLSIAAKKVHYYHILLGRLGFDPNVPLSEEFWAQIPIMTRGTLQDEKQRLLSTDIPQEYQPFTKVNSSGSTGMPVEVYQPSYKRTFFSATNLLEDVIHGADFSKKSASIRIFKGMGLTSEGKDLPHWGAPASDLFHTGPSALLDARQDPDVQADWVIRQNPAYLQIFPSNLVALLPLLRERGAKLSNLHYIRSVGEQLPSYIREEVRDLLGVKIVDAYSSQEVGFMAIQCPEHDHYHLLQDACFTEILNDENKPCAPGEIGRVVVTDLLNPAFPLIRYDIGDYAEAGAPCDCGRGWPVVNRIMGRVRNLVTFPDGSRQWPMTGGAHFAKIAPVRQHQMIQETPMALRILLVSERPLTDDEKAEIVARAHQHLGSKFDTSIEEVGEISRGENGKFEDFRSNVTPEMIAAARRQYA